MLIVQTVSCSFTFHNWEQKNVYDRHIYLLPPANVVCEGYVFTPVCHSVHRVRVSASVHDGMHSAQCIDMATAADGTHPTGMHSCLNN